MTSLYLLTESIALPSKKNYARPIPYAINQPTNMGSDEDKKKERKEKIKQEAEELGITYKELKEQKKAAKENKKSRESDKLVNPDHKDDMKRMRTWSHDEKEDPEVAATKRRRTRSMDAKEEKEAVVGTKSIMTPEEWRKDLSLTIKGHGKYNGHAAKDFPDPFFKFTDSPFSPAILKSFDQAGFTAPTSIQAQVCFMFPKLESSFIVIVFYQHDCNAIFLENLTKNLFFHSHRHGPLHYAEMT